MVLLLFNAFPKNVNATLTYKEIYERTGIETKELKRTLQSLACAKIRVLRKRPKSASINDTDKFSFKNDFKHSYFRIKVYILHI